MQRSAAKVHEVLPEKAKTYIDRGKPTTIEDNIVFPMAISDKEESLTSPKGGEA